MIELLNTWGAAWAKYYVPVLIQNSVFLALIFLTLRLLRNTHASLRYAVCFVGMVKLLLPPFLPIGFPGAEKGVAVLIPVTGLPLGMPSYLTGSAVESAGGARLGLAGLLLAIWMSAGVLYLVRTVLAYLRLKRDLSDAVPVREPGGAPSPRRTVHMLRTAAIRSPLTLGLLHPKVYVPEAWNGWNSTCRRMVLAHEGAHTEMWDRLGLVLQTAATVLYLFHPLVWLLNRRMNAYREMICDDVATGRSPVWAVEYSRHLIDTAEVMVAHSTSAGSASALLTHRNGLFNRVRYQMEANKVRSMSAASKSVVFAALAIVVLPLSFYCGKTEPGRSGAGTVAGGASSSMKEVTVALKPGRTASVAGRVTSIDRIAEVLEPQLPSDRQTVLIRLSCEEGVTMDAVSEVHGILVGMDLRKVIYEGPAEEGLPLVLPSTQDNEALARMGGEQVAAVEIGTPGLAVLDGTPVKFTELKQAIGDRLARDPYLVVSLVWKPTAAYEDFVMALGLAKAAGATRIAVQIGA